MSLACVVAAGAISTALVAADLPFVTIFIGSFQPIFLGAFLITGRVPLNRYGGE